MTCRGLFLGRWTRRGRAAAAFLLQAQGAFAQEGAAASDHRLLAIVLGGALAATVLGSFLLLIRANRRLRAREESLGRSEERYGRVVRGTRDGIWEWNLKTGEVYFSAHCLDLMGFEPGEEVRDIAKFLTRCNLEDVEAMREAVRTHLRTRAPFDVRFRVKGRSGRHRWFAAKAQAQWGRDGRATYMSGSITDITAAKKIESTLHHLAGCVHTPGGGDFFGDLARHLAENLEMEFVRIDHLDEATGLSRTLAVSRDGDFSEASFAPFEDLLCGELEERGVCCHAEGVCELFPGDEALRRIGAQSCIGTALRDGEGRRIGFIAAIGRRSLEDPEGARAVVNLVGLRASLELDRRRAEEEKERVEKVLSRSQRIEAVGRLAGGVAHEFNNMLGVILGHAQMAQMELGPQSPVADDITQIVLAARRSAETVSQLLTFAGKQPSVPMVIDLNEAVARSVDLLRPLIGEDVRLSFTPGEAVPLVNLDPAQLELVITNLVTNARDAVRSGGEIHLATCPVPPPAAMGAFGGASEKWAALTVSDDGCGMGGEELARIFEPFYTTKELGKGTGLGLPTVHGIVQQAGGGIRVDSAPGEGATFTLSFPGVEGEPCEAAPRAGEPTGTGETILVVEDERAILSLARKVLTGLGYRVLAAQTPREALALVEREPEDSVKLIITDVVMPQMNGSALCERVKERCPGARCLLMSGYAAEVVAQENLPDHGVDFLSKPFDIRELGEKVREMLAAG